MRARRQRQTEGFSTVLPQLVLGPVAVVVLVLSSCATTGKCSATPGDLVGRHAYVGGGSGRISGQESDYRFASDRR